MCRALTTSASGYYAACRRASSMRGERQTLLISTIQATHVASRHMYGAPRAPTELCAQGFACSLNTVAKLMRQAQIVREVIRWHRVTVDSQNTKNLAELLK